MMNIFIKYIIHYIILEKINKNIVIFIKILYSIEIIIILAIIKNSNYLKSMLLFFLNKN